MLRYELHRGLPEKNGGADIVVIREMSVIAMLPGIANINLVLTTDQICLGRCPESAH